MASDRNHFATDLVERLSARARAIRAQIRARIGFHTAYQRALIGQDGQVRPEAVAMLADLRRYCFADASTFDENERTHLLQEGQRRVWLRIEAGLRFDREKIDHLRRQLEELESDE